MSNQERKFFVFYDANAEGQEPSGEYDFEHQTVRPVNDKTPCLSAGMNFGENPGEGITFEEAVD